ncbi:hypothetical protein OGAPHI_000026 [Ogataea philodendri]|uniref:Uncharacterized protein n=1 Tax=Ogataea philodendri TaxID=1378263 RepID=A0A9P8TAZ2_9ASCO|nr:uncharacterized protein OGAPHI_000026 [Ogataea philodendri]KAH3671840.1 hypothetical protein OGAPHI_000026 [Ogataea philodendri]
MTKAQNARNLARHFEGIGQIFSDWDDTITAKDTISLIFDVLGANAEHGADYFFKFYMTNFNKFQTETLPGKPFASRDSVEKEVQYQQATKESEKSSIYEAVRLKVFKGISRSTFQGLTTKVPIKLGFYDFYKTVSQSNIKFTVLSINWTGLLIQKYFEHFTKQPYAILVNEFEFDHNGICTGNVDPAFDIRTGFDKLALIKQAVGMERSIYVGDSSTDVLSMIYCDKAIIMSGGSASKCLKRLGYKVYNINDEISEKEAKFVKYLEVDNWNDLFLILYPNTYGG